MEMRKVSEPYLRMGHLQVHSAMRRALVETGLLPSDPAKWAGSPAGLVAQVRENMVQLIAKAKDSAES
jgi:hypothetical protein